MSASRFVSLPDELQLAPLFAFARGTAGRERRWVAAGNFYGVQPYEGRYDANNPMVFSYSNGFRCVGVLTQEAGEWRDVKMVNSKLILARNNGRLLRVN